MGFTNEFWDSIQERAVNPFRSNESNAVNRLTRILTLGNNYVLEPEKCALIDYKTVRVLATHYIKDDVYIHFKQDFDLDFTDIDNYYSLTDRGMNRAGIYYVVLHYVFVESIPFPIAKIKILKNQSELTPAFLLLCNANVEYNSLEDRFEIASINFQNVPILNIGALRIGIDASYGQSAGLKLTGLMPNPTFPVSDKFELDAGYFIDGNELKVRFISKQEIGPFSVLQNQNKKRYDLVTIALDGQIKIYQGQEYEKTEPLVNCLRELPYEEIPICFVQIDETDVVKVISSDIIDVRNIFTPPQDYKNEVLGLLDGFSYLYEKISQMEQRIQNLERLI